MINTALRCISMILLLQLSGCAAMVVGGAAGGGYYVANSGRTTAEIKQDAAITSAVTARYVKDELLNAFDINVDTRRGTVTLLGSVASHRAEQRAIELARSVTGVQRVDSRLSIEPR